MPDDLGTLLIRLMQLGVIEQATVTVVLRPPPSPPDSPPVCNFVVGPVSQKR
jgi:hypothetical protein